LILIDDTCKSMLPDILVARISDTDIMGVFALNAILLSGFKIYATCWRVDLSSNHVCLVRRSH
jgi:hypothetical protein